MKKILRKNKVYKIYGKTGFNNPYFAATSYTEKSVLVTTKKDKLLLDMRVDFSLQKTKGSVYKSLVHKLDVAKQAIKNDEFDALVILINTQYIPDDFVRYIIDKVKDDRFIYIKTYEEKPSDDLIDNNIVDFAEMLVELKKAETKIKKYCIEG